jgi:hypothetical protein
MELWNWENFNHSTSCASLYIVKTLRPTLDKGLGFNFLGTNLDSFEANWILELDYNVVPNLIIGSPNQNSKNQILPPDDVGSFCFGISLPYLLCSKWISWIHRDPNDFGVCPWIPNDGSLIPNFLSKWMS